MSRPAAKSDRSAACHWEIVATDSEYFIPAHFPFCCPAVIFHSPPLRLALRVIHHDQRPAGISLSRP